MLRDKECEVLLIWKRICHGGYSAMENNINYDNTNTWTRLYRPGMP